MADTWIAESIVQFTHSPVWKNPVHDFIDDNCSSFVDELEMKLEYTELHKQFVQLVDKLLSNFVEELGVTDEQAAAALSKVLAQKDTDLGKEVDQMITEIYSADNFELFRRMMVRRNVELDLLALGTLKIDFTDDAKVDEYTHEQKKRELAMRENAGYQEDDALQLAIEESLKYQKMLELEDAQLLEALEQTKHAAAEQARLEKEAVEKEAAALAKTDPVAAVQLQKEKVAIIEQQEAQQVQELEAKTLLARERKIKEAFTQMAPGAVSTEANLLSGANQSSEGHESSQANEIVSSMQAGAVPPTATSGSQPPVAHMSKSGLPGAQSGHGSTLVSQQDGISNEVSGVSAPYQGMTGKMGFGALPSLSIGNAVPLRALKEKVAGQKKEAIPGFSLDGPTMTKAEMEERAKQMRLQRDMIVKRTKESRQQQLTDFAAQNNVHLDPKEPRDAEQQLTVDIARRLRGDILGELQK